MTDNNADDTNGQSTNLSRRGAVALLGTAAVGGTAATGAFSQLTADRPVEVEVVGSGGDSELGANNTTSRLQITNNHNERINATISTNDLANVSVSGLNTTDASLNGTQSANLSSSGSEWELTELRPGDTTEIEFEQNETSSTTPVAFDVVAFSGTNGYTIGSDQAVDVRTPPASGVYRWTFDSYNTDGTTAIDVWGDNDATIDSSVTTGVKGANYTGDAYEFDGTNGVNSDKKVGISGTESRSISFYANSSIADSSTSVRHMVNYGESSTGSAFGLFVGGDDTIKFYGHGSGADFTTKWDADENWHHWTVTYDGTNIAVYRDGTDKDGGTATIDTTDTDIHIAERMDGSFRFSGVIDDVRIYNKALSDQEVENLYKTGHING